MIRSAVSPANYDVSVVMRRTQHRSASSCGRISCAVKCHARAWKKISARPSRKRWLWRKARTRSICPAGVDLPRATRLVWRTRADTLFRQTPHHVEFVVRAHGGDVGHPVRQCEERRDRRDIPNVVVAETVAGDLGEIRFRNPVRLGAHLHCEVEHGSLAWRDIRLAVVDGDLVRYLRVL